MSDKKRKRAAEYEGLDMQKAKEKYREVEERSSGDFVTLKEGWNFFFILPPWPGSVDRTIWKDVQRHGQYVCPKKAADKRCLICEEMPRRAKKGDTKWLSENRLKSRALFNVVKKSKIKELPNNPEAYIKILGVASGVFEDILAYINLEDVDISKPSAAVVVGINRKGTGMNTRYKLHMGDSVDISKYITADVMSALINLDTCRAALPATAQEMRKVIKGAADDDDFDDDEDLKDEDDEEITGDDLSEEDEVFNEADEDEDERPSSKSAKLKKKKQAKDLDEDEDDEDLDDDEDEEKPKSSRAKKKSKEEDEEDDEEDDEDLDLDDDDEDDELDLDDDEDEEDEEPKQKSKGSKDKSSNKKRSK